MIDDIIEDSAKNYAQRIDDIIIGMLKRNGVKSPYTPDNIEKQGYKLISESRPWSRENFYTYTLLKIVDETNISIDSGGKTP